MPFSHGTNQSSAWPVYSGNSSYNNLISGSMPTSSVQIEQMATDVELTDMVIVKSGEGSAPHGSSNWNANGSRVSNLALNSMLSCDHAQIIEDTRGEVSSRAEEHSPSQIRTVDLVFDDSNPLSGENSMAEQLPTGKSFATAAIVDYSATPMAANVTDVRQ